METPKMITRERIPCWYELSYQPRNKTPQLLLRIHTEYAYRLPNQTIGRDAVVEQLMDSFGFKGWSGAIGQDLGFDHALKYRGVVDGFHEYCIPTPHWQKLTGNPCPDCNGTGEDKDMGGDCFSCCFGVLGREVEQDMQGLYAVSATLTEILQAMQYPESETSAPFPQLFTVTTIAMAGASFELGGSYGLDAAAFLCGRCTGKQVPIPEMEATMIEVWESMELSVSEFHRRSFNAYTQEYDGWLNVGCPGDGCGLHPLRFRGSRNGNGYDFGSHNVDTPMQQLALLAALAALHDSVRVPMRTPMHA